MFKLIVASVVVCSFVFGFCSLSLSINKEKIKSSLVSVIAKGGEVGEEQYKKQSPAVKAEAKKLTNEAKAEAVKMAKKAKASAIAKLKKTVDSL